MPTKRPRDPEVSLITSTPRVGLLLFPFKHHFTGVNEQNFMEVDRINATNSVKRFSYQTSKSSPAGAFSIELTSDKNWTNIIRPGDWLLLYESSFGIGINDGGTDTTKGLRCLGNVDRVSRQKTITNDGTKIFTYRIDGKDFGKVFERIELYYNPFDDRNLKNLELYAKTGVKITGSPIVFLENYLEVFLGSGKITDMSSTNTEQDLGTLPQFDQMRIPQKIINIFKGEYKNGKLMDILRKDFHTGDNDELRVEGFSFSIPADKMTKRKLWDVLRGVSNETMNELFLSMKYYPEEDLVCPTITLRKIPFTQGVYQKLPRAYIHESMIITDDIGFNDHERTNWMSLEPLHAMIANYPMAMSIFEELREDSDTKEKLKLFPFTKPLSLKRYGYQPKSLQTEFAQPNIELGKTSTPLDKVLLISWMKELVAIWENYERFESGIALIKGFSEVNEFKEGKEGVIKINDKPIKNPRPNIMQGNEERNIISDQYNIGSNVFFNTRDRLYHLEGFSLEWEAPGTSHVTLALTRGVHWQAKGNYKFVDEADKMDTKEGSEQKDLSVSVVTRK